MIRHDYRAYPHVMFTDGVYMTGYDPDFPRCALCVKRYIPATAEAQATAMGKSVTRRTEGARISYKIASSIQS